LGRAALDPFPFPLLSAAVSTIGLYLAAMILISQRHDDEMATRREQMTLELAILSEQSAKIIALLEEFRRNDPNQGNDRDEVAEALAEPACAGRATRYGCGKGRGQRLDRQNAQACGRTGTALLAPSSAFLPMRSRDIVASYSGVAEPSAVPARRRAQPIKSRVRRGRPTESSTRGN
jgi:Protein of unknown function (DUF1003)